jgi:hypothetical protein
MSKLFKVWVVDPFGRDKITPRHAWTEEHLKDFNKRVSLEVQAFTNFWEAWGYLQRVKKVKND